MNDKVQVCTNIRKNIVIQAKKENIRLNYIFERGWDSIKGDTSSSQRLEEAEQTIMKLQQLVTNINTKYWELKDTLDKK